MTNVNPKIGFICTSCGYKADASFGAEHEPEHDECIDWMEYAGVNKEIIKFWRDKEG